MESILGVGYEQFFETDQTKQVDKGRSVIMHLDGKALQWHHEERRSFNRGKVESLH